ncbi:MAG: FMN-binding protein [Rhodothermaceae bacterium]|nr:FMN-binding protein [Rhodothermaceae bacterium]
MYKSLSLLAVALVLISASSVNVSAQVAKSNDVISLRDGLKEMLQAKGATSLKKLSINVDADHSEKLREQGVSASGSYTVYKGLGQEGETIGSVLIINERGKEGPLQVLVAVDEEGQVYDVGFTLFGEDKGKPALNWPFLRQFLDKTAIELVNTEVDGVSGATWTSDSVTSAVKRGAALYTLFLVEN